MRFGATVILTTIVILALVVVARHGDRARRARFLRRAGFALMAVSSGFLGLFIVGETMSDPGGWKGLGLVSLWGAPLVVGAVMVWHRPDRALRVLAGLIAAAIGLSVWFAVNPGGWRSFEDRHGPVRTLTTFALAAIVALLGLKRTAVAGLMLLVLGLVPVLVSSLGHGALSSLAAASSVPVGTGVLYLLSAAVARGMPPPHAATGRRDRPEAA